MNYELGLCHALGVPTILISKTVEDVPFDYRHRRFILYNTEFARWEERLAGALQKTIATILGETGVDAELPWPYHTQSPVEVEKMALREQRMSVAELMEGIDYHKAAQGLIPYCLALMQNVPEEEQEKLQRGIQLLTAAEMDEAIKVRILGLYLFNVVGLAVLTAAVDSLRVHLKRAAQPPTRTSTPPPDPN